MHFSKQMISSPSLGKCQLSSTWMFFSSFDRFLILKAGVPHLISKIEMASQNAALISIVLSHWRLLCVDLTLIFKVEALQTENSRKDEIGCYLVNVRYYSSSLEFIKHEIWRQSRCALMVLEGLSVQLQASTSVWECKSHNWILVKSDERSTWAAS